MMNCFKKKAVSLADMSGRLAASIFQELNVADVLVETSDKFKVCFIVTDADPRDLVYPEGWYYDNGRFTNRGNCSGIFYSAIHVVSFNYTPWETRYSGFTTGVRVVKMCEMSSDIAAYIFSMLNRNCVIVTSDKNDTPVIRTDKEPKKLIYPAGWYYCNGAFRNKHNSDTGMYSEIFMYRFDDTAWSCLAKYCTPE